MAEPKQRIKVVKKINEDGVANSVISYINDKYHSSIPAHCFYVKRIAKYLGEPYNPLDANSKTINKWIDMLMVQDQDRCFAAGIKPNNSGYAQMVLKFTVTTRDMCKDKLDPATLARLNELSSVYHEQKDKISFANRTNTFEDPRYRSIAMQITDLSELPPKWTFLKVMSALRCYCPLRVGELVATYLDKQPGKNYLDLETGMWTLINTKTAVRRFDLKLFAPDLLPILRQHPTGKGPLITTDRGNPYTASAICTRIQRTFGTTQDFAREVFETEFVETIKDPKLLLYVRTTVMGHTGDTARLHYVDRSPREPEPEVIPPPPEFS